MAEVAFCRHEWDFERKYDEGFLESGNSVNRAGFFSSFITLFVRVKLSHPRGQMQFSSANHFSTFSSKALILLLYLAQASLSR